MAKIEHKALDLGIKGVDPVEPTNSDHMDLSERLHAYMDYAMLTAAAAVYVRTGSLDYVASALDEAGFDLPAWAYVNPEYDGYDDPRAALQAWVEKNEERILALSRSNAAQTIASGDMYE